MKIRVVTPAGSDLRNGNRATAARWSGFLRELGHEVVVEEAWDGGEDPDLLVALHARRSHPSIKRYAAAYPGRPLIVALTGTDLYRDIRSDEAAKESLELATRLVALQDVGLDELGARHRAKARVIYQSAEPVPLRPPDADHFDVCVIGHLRAEKDPFRTALAARLLPPSSRVRVTHAGRPYDEGFEREARLHDAENPRYRWVGELSRRETRRLLTGSRLLAQTSVVEGGANAVSEALASGVPVVASRIPGNVGMLGGDYPGYYEPDDEKTLAQLLYRAETDGAFYDALKARCEARGRLVLPGREKAALDALVRETIQNEPEGYNRDMDEKTRIRLTKYSTKAG